jgi:hypothetical protein
MQETLAQIAKIIDDTPGFVAELGDETYLIRFNRDNVYEDGYDGPENNLALMADLHITFEPWKACMTPTYCIISIDDAPTAARQMMAICKAYSEGKLPMNADGEGTGEAFLDKEVLAEIFKLVKSLRTEEAARFLTTELWQSHNVLEDEDEDFQRIVDLFTEEER